MPIDISQTNQSSTLYNILEDYAPECIFNKIKAGNYISHADVQSLRNEGMIEAFIHKLAEKVTSYICGSHKYDIMHQLRIIINDNSFEAKNAAMAALNQIENNGSIVKFTNERYPQDNAIQQGSEYIELILQCDANGPCIALTIAKESDFIAFQNRERCHQQAKKVLENLTDPAIQNNLSQESYRQAILLLNDLFSIRDHGKFITAFYILDTFLKEHNIDEKHISLSTQLNENKRSYIINVENEVGDTQAPASLTMSKEIAPYDALANEIIMQLPVTIQDREKITDLLSQCLAPDTSRSLKKKIIIEINQRAGIEVISVGKQNNVSPLLSRITPNSIYQSGLKYQIVTTEHTYPILFVDEADYELSQQLDRAIKLQGVNSLGINERNMLFRFFKAHPQSLTAITEQSSSFVKLFKKPEQALNKVKNELDRFITQQATTLNKEQMKNLLEWLQPHNQQASYVQQYV